MNRYALRNKDVRVLIQQLPDLLRSNIERFGGKRVNVEAMEVGRARVYTFNGCPFIVEMKGRLLPTLKYPELLEGLPSVVVDAGAVPHVCNGADIMAPGVVKIYGAFPAGATVVIREERFEKAIALGLSKYGSAEIQREDRGKVLETVHHVGDGIWESIKSL